MTYVAKETNALTSPLGSVPRNSEAPGVASAADVAHAANVAVRDLTIRLGANTVIENNNIINTTTGERLYNVNMAATILTSLVPLAVYFICGRWFVRGIASGAVKG